MLPLMSVGEVGWVVVLSPSWPLLLEPHARTFPSVSPDLNEHVIERRTPAPIAHTRLACTPGEQ
jgi:hypothetical protein